MTTATWMTLGIWVSGLLFSVVGFLIIREIRRYDENLAAIKRQLSKHSAAHRATLLTLVNAGMLPPETIVRFPSPEEDFGEIE